MSSKEFDSIGLVKKDMELTALLKEAAYLDVSSRFLLSLYGQMTKITEKFLKIEGRLSALERCNPASDKS